jgi:hypothetical protein
MFGGPAQHALLAVLTVGLVALGQLVLARRWDGLPLVVWLSVVAALVAPPRSPASWGGWLLVGLCLAATMVRRPRWLGRADVLAWSILLSGGLTAVWALGLPDLACLSVGAVGAIGLGAATLDRRGPPWRTRWVGEIPVRERSSPRG